MVGQIRRLEAFSLIEASKLLLLVGVAVPLKHLGGWAVGVSVLGPIHGLAFALRLAELQAVAGGGWMRGEAARLFVASVIFFAAGIDFGLVLLSRLFDDCVARTTERLMGYTPMPPFGTGTPDRAGEDATGKSSASWLPRPRDFMCVISRRFS